MAKDTPTDSPPPKSAALPDPHSDVVTTPNAAVKADGSDLQAGAAAAGTNQLTKETLSATYGPGAVVIKPEPITPIAPITASTGFIDMDSPFDPSMFNADAIQQRINLANNLAEQACVVQPGDLGTPGNPVTAADLSSIINPPATSDGGAATATDGSQNAATTADATGDLAKSPILNWLFTPDATNPATTTDKYPEGNPTFDVKNDDGVEVKGVDTPSNVIANAGDQSVVYDKKTHTSTVASKDGLSLTDDGTNKVIYDSKLHGTLQWNAKTHQGEVIGPDGNVEITFTSQADLTRQLQEKMDKNKMMTLVQGHEAMTAAIRTAMKNQKPSDETVQQFSDGQGNFAILSHGVLYETSSSGAVTIQKGEARYRIENGVAVKESRDPTTGLVTFTQTSDLSSIPGLQIKGKSVLLDGKQIVDNDGKVTVGDTTIDTKAHVLTTGSDHGTSTVTSGAGTSSIKNGLGTLSLGPDGNGTLAANADGSKSQVGDAGKTIQFNQNGISDIGGPGQSSVIMQEHSMVMKTPDGETTTVGDNGTLQMQDAKGHNLLKINRDGSVNVADKIDIDAAGIIHAHGSHGGSGSGGDGKSSVAATSAIALHVANMADISSAMNLRNPSPGEIAAYMSKLGGEMASLSEYANMATGRGLLQYAERMIAASQMTQAALTHLSSLSTTDRSTQVTQPSGDAAKTGKNGQPESTTIATQGARPLLQGRVATSEISANNTETTVNNTDIILRTAQVDDRYNRDNIGLQGDEPRLHRGENRFQAEDLLALNRNANPFSFDPPANAFAFDQSANTVTVNSQDNGLALNAADDAVTQNPPDNLVTAYAPDNPGSAILPDDAVALNTSSPITFDQSATTTGADQTATTTTTTDQPDNTIAFSQPEISPLLNRIDDNSIVVGRTYQAALDPPESTIALNQPANIFTNQREVSGGGIVAEQLLNRDDQTYGTDYAMEPLPRLELAGEGMVSTRKNPARKSDFEEGMVSES